MGESIENVKTNPSLINNVMNTKQNKKRKPIRTALAIGLSLTLALGFIFTGACASAGIVPGSSAEARQKRIEMAPNWQEGKFVNTLPAKLAPISFGLIVKMLVGGENATPEEAPPIIERTAADFTAAPAEGLRVTWLGHSTMILEIDGSRLLLDPVWSERTSPVSFAGPKRFHKTPLPLKELLKLKIDAVVISHNHYDHLDEATITTLGKTGVRFIVPLGVGAHLEEWGVHPLKITELYWWENTKVGDLELTSTPARHFSGRSATMSDRNKTLWTSWAFRGPKHRVYFSGDTSYFPGFKEIGERLGPFDLTMLEVGAYNKRWTDAHMGPEQAVRAHQDLRGKVMLPIHWGTFELALHAWTAPVERTIVAAENSGVTLVTPRPGQSIIPAAPPAIARWWPTTPWKSASEDPIVSSGLKPEDRVNAGVNGTDTEKVNKDKTAQAKLKK